MTENPLAIIGLPKSLANLLYGTGRLKDYLSARKITDNRFMHSDQNVGNDNYLARLNGAYDTLQRNPDKISEWMTDLQEVCELEKIVTGLVAAVEERDNKIAELNQLKSTQNDSTKTALAREFISVLSAYMARNMVMESEEILSICSDYMVRMKIIFPGSERHGK